MGRTPGRRRRRPEHPALRALGLAVVLGAVVLGGAVACSDGDTTTGPRPISEEEASRLADVLTLNYQTGGAAVVADIPYGTASFHLTGRIDWANHVGRVTVDPKVDGDVPQRPSFDLAFNPRVVFEQVPGLAEAMTARGLTPANWVARPLDTAGSPLHVVLSLLDSLSSTQRDNPVLLQSRGVTWQRTDSVDGQPVDVFRSDRTTYWVARSDGRLLRFEADVESTGSTATITLSDFAPTTVPVPSEEEIVDLAAVSDIYHELTGTS